MGLCPGFNYDFKKDKYWRNYFGLADGLAFFLFFKSSKADCAEGLASEPEAVATFAEGLTCLGGLVKGA